MISYVSNVPILMLIAKQSILQAVLVIDVVLPNWVLLKDLL
jgi:hypothetical protein